MYRSLVRLKKTSTNMLSCRALCTKPPGPDAGMPDQLHPKPYAFSSKEVTTPRNRSAAEIEASLPSALRERRRRRDQVIKSFTPKVRIALLNNSLSVTEAKRRHGLSDAATRVLGRAMAAASLLASWQRGDERLSLTFNAAGPLSLVAAEASRSGEVRGYVSEPKFEMPPSAAVGFAMRAGTLTIIKHLYERATPYSSVVPLAGADVSSDIMNYYRLSEQIPAIVELETIINHAGEVTFSGGLIAEALPPVPGDSSNIGYLDIYKERIKMLPPTSILFGEDSSSLRQVLDRLAPGEIEERSVEKIVIDFHCRCSKEKFKKSLITLGEDGLREFFNLAGEERTLKCQYCSTAYQLEDDDMRQLMTALQDYKKSKNETSQRPTEK